MRHRYALFVKRQLHSDGSGSKIFDPGRVGSGWVSYLWFGLELGKFQLKTSNFSIFFPSGQKKLLRVGSKSTRVKAGSASYLLRVKSKLGSGRVGSGQGPSLQLHLSLGFPLDDLSIQGTAQSPGSGRSTAGRYGSPLDQDCSMVDPVMNFSFSLHVKAVLKLTFYCHSSVEFWLDVVLQQ